MNSTRLPRIGVLGGMGPLATADFLAKLAHVTPAARDQDHFPVTVDSTPQIPDRVAALEGRGADPLPDLVAAARRLHAAGCDLIAMPCNTAHLWYERLAPHSALPMVHIADAVAARLGDARTVGLIGTSATLAHGLYQKRIGAGKRWLLPDVGEMKDLIVPGIAAVKSGDLATGKALLSQAVRQLAARGADAIVLACTEMPLVVGAADVAVPLVDATLELARHTIAHATRIRAGLRAAA